MHWMRDGVAPSIDCCDRAREHRLGRPGDVLEEHVAAARERGEDELDLLALAVDDRLDVVREALRERRRAPELALLGRHRGFHALHRAPYVIPALPDVIPALSRNQASSALPGALATLRAMSRTFLVLTVVLVALMAAGCMGGGDTSQEEFAAQVVETRNRTDAALEHMTGARTYDDLLDRIDLAGDAAQAAADDLDDAGAPSELEDQAEELVEALRALGDELAATAEALDDEQFDGLDRSKASSFTNWNRAQSALDDLREQGVERPAARALLTAGRLREPRSSRWWARSPLELGRAAGAGHA